MKTFTQRFASFYSVPEHLPCEFIPKEDVNIEGVLKFAMDNLKDDVLSGNAGISSYMIEDADYGKIDTTELNGLFKCVLPDINAVLNDSQKIPVDYQDSIFERCIELGLLNDDTLTRNVSIGIKSVNLMLNHVFFVALNENLQTAHDFLNQLHNSLFIIALKRLDKIYDGDDGYQWCQEFHMIDLFVEY